MGAAPRTNKPPTFGMHIGIRFDRVEDGASWFWLDIETHHLNVNGVLHGGVPYSLADNGMGAALHTMLGDDEICATIEMKMNYLKPVTAGRLVCESRVIRKGRSIAVLEATVRLMEGNNAGDGNPVSNHAGDNKTEPVAVALCTYAILPKPPHHPVPDTARI